VKSTQAFTLGVSDHNILDCYNEEKKSNLLAIVLKTSKSDLIKGITGEAKKDSNG
jgi:hypothetical protein